MPYMDGMSMGIRRFFVSTSSFQQRHSFANIDALGVEAFAATLGLSVHFFLFVRAAGRKSPRTGVCWFLVE